MKNVIAQKIKSLCKDKNISENDLVEYTGLTSNQISRILNSDTLPSLSSLIKIARALGVRVGTFLDDSSNIKPIVHRSTDEKQTSTFSSRLSETSSHMDFFSLAGNKSDRNMEPFLIHINPSKTEELLTSTHEGEEFIYVIKGSVRVRYGRDEYIINQGDSIYYDSIIQHIVTSANDEQASILAVVYSPF